ncbi:MAG: DNA mismatch repair endonuclease MutL, partial [Bacillota bacterium]|nr:DNA mismatch repair endonuclease MutL [Bacillota bacterium]
MKIIQLAKEIADKIAAGEVVERPLSVVKELVENAVDAGASSIVVEIRNGGKTYIRVTDDGFGIPADELETAFLRHATSKIRSAEDLERIQTLGFRGEALASIAAVSRVEVVTKTADARLGMRVKFEGSQLTEKGEVGCPDGSTFVVTDLFYNTPARLKFMKKEAAESSLIIDFISKMALAYPHIRFRMINGDSVLFSTNGKGNLYQNILTIFSRDLADHLLSAEAEKEGMTLQAWLSPPENSRSNRKYQIFFVNGRWVNSRLLEAAVKDAYAEKMPEGRHPVAFLFLEMDPARLDVNIHPNKKEVRFDHEGEVRVFISEALRRALHSQNAVGQLKGKWMFRERPV